MKVSALPRLKGFGALGKVSRLLMVSFGLSAGAYGQDIEPYVVTETAALWREWMSVWWREPSLISGPRIYLMTDREILQTSPDKASFQSGSYRMVLADGSVPDVDGDADLYTDSFEAGNKYADFNDPIYIPLDDALNPLPTDAFPILIANGEVLGIANATLGTNTQAKLVRNKAGAAVRVIGAPASKMVRPVSFRDLSSQFYYYFVIPGQTTGVYNEYPLSLYYLRKDFPNPGDGNALETSMVPGGYTVEFPTIQNAPTGKSTAQVAHKLVPNGALTVGLKKPTWLVRSLKSFEKDNTPPVDQKWVNGKLKFDPYLPMSISWDNLVANGLASSADYIEMWFEDETLGRVSYTFRVNASTSSLSISLSDTTYLFYGTIRDTLEAKTFPLKVNGHIVMKYLRYSGRQPSADLSSVTVRVPIEMSTSYPSWRKELFPLASLSDSVSGPSADPDKDGLTNQQEFNQGTDPLVASLAVVNPTSSGITISSATLGATLVQDPLTLDNPLAGANVQIYDRGVVYSRASVNSTPVIDGPGVMRVVSSPAEIGTYTVPVDGLSSSTQYCYRGYMITSAGTYYSTPVSTFTTLFLPPSVTLPNVTTPTSSAITSTSATLGGNVTSDGGSPIIERGVVYSITSTSDNPFVGGVGTTKLVGAGTTGVFTLNAASLLPNTAYSFRAYAINSVGTSHTSTIGTFTTLPAVTAPVITSPTFASVTTSSATLGGNVTNTGGSAVTQRGVVFSLTSANPNPIIGGTGVTKFSATTFSTGIFTVNATGLVPGASYSFKAYATNAIGTSYTTLGTFTTLGTLATVTSPTITGITASSATLGANLTSNGASAITDRGFIYSRTAINSNPVLGGTGVIPVSVPGTALGVYTNLISGLLANTGYTFKAYVINGAGTAYGAPSSFFTTLPPLTVTSPTAVDITATTATLGGTVVSDSGTTVTERGVVYSLVPNVDPIIGGPGVLKKVGSGTMGIFTVPVIDLAPDQNYYYRAYATNSSATSYSATASFKTLPVQLLGQSLVQWTSQQAPAQQRIQSFAVEESPQLQAQAESVPEFVYLKDPSEARDSLNYQIEVSADFSKWQPIDVNEWLVQETPESLTARWNSPNNPPARVFFRVNGRK